MNPPRRFGLLGLPSCTTYPFPEAGSADAVTVPSTAPVWSAQPVARLGPLGFGAAATPTTPAADVAPAGHVEFPTAAAPAPAGTIVTLIGAIRRPARTVRTGALRLDVTEPPVTAARYPAGYATAGTAMSVSEPGPNTPRPSARRGEYVNEKAFVDESKLQADGVPATSCGYGRPRAATIA